MSSGVMHAGVRMKGGRSGLGLLLLGVGVLLPIGEAQAATVRNVPSTYATIQAAIDASVNGDTVQIAAGTYTGAGNTNIDTKGKAITVISTSGPATTIIDCKGTGRGFFIHTAEGAGTRISGLTIQNGKPQQTGSTYLDNGGGILIDGASPTLDNLVLTGNQAGWGGGIAVMHSNYNDTTLTQPSIKGCTMTNNTAMNGGGLSANNALPTVQWLTIDSNYASHGGGIFWGMGNTSLPAGVLNNVIITHNDTDVYGIGGGISVEYGNLEVRNSLIAGNSAGQGGGGIAYHNYNGKFSISGSTVAGNKATKGNGLYFYAASGNQANIQNSIFWNGGGELYDDMVSNPSTNVTTISYSNISGGFTGTGNLNVDPLFKDAATGDYHLQFKSPCKNVGDPAYVPGTGETDIDGDARVLARRVDMGADEARLK